MSRERVEDLGRLSVMLDGMRKDFPMQNHKSVEDRYKEILADLTELTSGGFGAIEEDQDTILWKLLCEIDQILEKIYECLDIAEGTDRLNEEVDGG